MAVAPKDMNSVWETGGLREVSLIEAASEGRDGSTGQAESGLQGQEDAHRINGKEMLLVGVPGQPV